MKKYVAILRGINVGGKRKLLMADLKLLCEALSWKDIKTYIQSGNILFSSTKKVNCEKEALMLHKVIKEKFDYEVPVIIVPFDELNKMAIANPYIQKDEAFDIKQLHLTFLATKPSASAIKETLALQYPPDEFEIKGNYVYLKILSGYSKTKLNNGFFEKKLGVKATTRNWKTVSKLVEISLGD